MRASAQSGARASVVFVPVRDARRLNSSAFVRMAASNADTLEAELDDMLGTAPLGGERPGDAAVSVATGTKPNTKNKKNKKERTGNASGGTGASVGDSGPDAAGVVVASAADDDADDDDDDGDSVVLDVAREHMYETSSEFTEAGHGVRRVVCWCATVAGIVVLVLMVVWAVRGL